ncbi:MAG TPA: Mov34/MPN/PAD-1 family protein [Kofleriaceae bacterium]|nr:Mov34/MPN/PAD-1 family protein [Kofleriaceae bacterium]
MSRLQFKHSRYGILQLGEDAVVALRSFEQHAPDATEAGGVLLGRYLRDGYDIVVDSITTPQPSDVRTRFGFDRNGEHQRLIDEAWERSNGTCNFLGDWHTHAEPYPRPSAIDLGNWMRMMREDIRDDEACFFVIVGQAEIRCWEGNRTTSSITRLERA